MPESKFTPAQAEEMAKRRRTMAGRFPVASLEDIIASKSATGREKDLADVRRLKQFKIEQERHTGP